ncbi:MAG: energy transducer TonB [Puniceicoccaceae bacterium]
MKISVRHSVLLAAVTLFAGIANLQASSADYTPVRLINPLETTLPNDLRHLLMENPRVAFHVKVGPNGQILDALAVEATHFGLLSKAEEKILEAKFEPASLKGEPVPGKITVIVTFYDLEQRAWKRGLVGAPQGGSVSDAVERRLYEANAASYRYGECNPKELDEPLQILESKLYLVHPPEEGAPKGKVVVKYYIDHQGHVHMPKVLTSDNKYLTLSVLKTLEETRFAPPKRNGKPALVAVRQPFNFD